MNTIISKVVDSANNPLKAGCLGTNTNSTPPPLPKHKFRKFATDRANRYALQYTAAYLARFEAEKSGVLPHDWHRISKCYHTRINPEVGVKISKSDKAYYVGVSACGSVWVCPICSPKIQNKRRAELTKLIAWLYSEGYECHMITFTFPHTGFDSLDDLLNTQKAALTKLRSGGAFTRAMKKHYDYQGMVRTLEITHGKSNGWHPHTHELWITKILSSDERKSFKERIINKWIKALGFNPEDDLKIVRDLKRRSVDIHWEAHDSDYLQKQDDSSYLEATGGWGADNEMARSNNKKGKKKGRHVFQILADFAEYKRPRDAKLFVEFAKTIKDHRKRQLLFSAGLKKRAGITEVEDAAIASTVVVTEDDAVDSEAGLISGVDWDYHIRKVRGLRARFLEAVENDGFEVAYKILEKAGFGFKLSEQHNYDVVAVNLLELPCNKERASTLKALKSNRSIIK